MEPLKYLITPCDRFTWVMYAQMWSDCSLSCYQQSSRNISEMKIIFILPFPTIWNYLAEFCFMKLLKYAIYNKCKQWNFRKIRNTLIKHHDLTKELWRNCREWLNLQIIFRIIGHTLWCYFLKTCFFIKCKFTTSFHACLFLKNC